MNKANTSTLNICDAIGNTPIVKLKNVVPENCADVFVKLEYFNPTGSYKDRKALAIIEEAEKRGELKKGMTVIESTAGSTGTSLALICAIKGYPLKIITSDAFAKEKLQSMKLFGAELEIIESEGGKITPDLIPKMIARTQELSKNESFYWARQFENTDSFEGYKIMANEIVAQIDGPIDIFCAAVGTGAMFTGVNLILKNAFPNMKSVVLEPSSAPFISTGIKGKHTVEGIAPGFAPPLLKKSHYDEARAIDENEARKMARSLASKEGIFAGTSTGMNVVAAIQIAKELGPNHTVVTVACDSGMKYLASGLFDEND